MDYIAAGCLGFLMLHLFDIVALRRMALAKPLAWTVGSGLLLYALAMASLDPEKLPLPLWSAWLGLALLAASLVMLVWSLFINLPFRRTYVASGVGDELITTGLYGLVRHPGVPAFVLVLLALILVSRSSLLLTAAPVFAALDVVLVVVQDRLVFGRMFTGYDRYRRRTPMLVPNRASLNTFMSSLTRQYRA